MSSQRNLNSPIHFFLLIRKLILCVWVYGFVYRVHMDMRCSQRPEGGVRSFGTGVTGNCKLPGGYGEQSSGPLREQQGLFNLGSIFPALFLFCFPVSLAVLGTLYATKVNLELVILLFLPLECWDDKCVPPPCLLSHLYQRCFQGGQGELTSLSLEPACNARKPGWSIPHLGPGLGWWSCSLLLSTSNCCAGNLGRKDPEESILGWGWHPGGGKPTLLAAFPSKQASL